VSGGPTIGVSVYSFTRDYRSGRYTFEELIRKCGECGLGPAIEIVGFQSVRGYPAVTDSFALRFRRLLDEAGLEPSALGGNIDVGRRPDRLMTHEETVETLAAQIAAAEKLGFRVLRVQFGASPDALEEALPLAERADVRLGVEVHAPHHVHHLTMLALRERFERLGSPYLGFVPDFGATLNAIPRGFLRHWRAQPGVQAELVDLTVAAWERVHRGESDAFVERRGALDAALAMGAQSSVRQVWGALTLYGHQRPADWSEIMAQVVHVHAKFYEIDDDGNEPSMSYDELMRVFLEGGYAGVLSTEWEGSAFASGADAFEIVRRQQELMRRHLLAGTPPVRGGPDASSASPGGT